MSRVLALVEGHTELKFIKEVLAPDLGHKGVYLSPTMIGKPGHKGGVRRWTIVRRDILAALKQDQQRHCTTMFDYYGLPSKWPGVAAAKPKPLDEIAGCIEDAIAEDIRREMGPSFTAARFLPYIQMHEFEALLFSDTAILAEVVESSSLASRFQAVVTECGEPEAIDDNPGSAPSKRILSLASRYQKVLHGAMAAKQIGLGTMREKCPYFAEWVARLENLGRQDR